MEEARIKHLELIQAVITRMAQNSFVYKGWAVTLIAAIFALAATDGLTTRYLLIALLPALAFWGLDGYHLRQERLFRKHYDATRNAPLDQWAKNPFSMNTNPYTSEVAGWLGVCLSRTVAGLYIPLILLTLAVTSLAAKG